MRVMVTGASGQVGRELEIALLNRGHEVLLCPHERLSICDKEAVEAAVAEGVAQLVINAAAYTNVEKAEGEGQTAAFEVNALGAGILAGAAARHGLPLLHISTDYVFSKETGRPHDEDEDTCVKCVYGRTKLEGEERVMAAGGNSLIVRASWIFGRFGRNFVKTMLRVAQERGEVAVVSDQRGNPTPARALAEALVLMGERVLTSDEDLRGIYHFAGAEATTWDEFAREIFRTARILNCLNHDVKVKSIASFQYQSAVTRPFDSRLNCDRLNRVFGIGMPVWQDYLPETLRAGFDELYPKVQAAEGQAKSENGQERRADTAGKEASDESN